MPTADLTITARLVKPLPGAVLRPVQAGGSGNVGDAVALNSSGYAVQADASAESTSDAFGLAVAQGGEGVLTFASGDALSVVVSGPVTGFSGLTPGSRVYLSATAGKLADGAPAAGVVRLVGIALSATDIYIFPALTDSVAAITDVDDSAADATYGADELAVLNDLTDAVNAILAALRANGIVTIA